MTKIISNKIANNFVFGTHFLKTILIQVFKLINEDLQLCKTNIIKLILDTF